MTATPAPALSADEQQRVAAFDAAPYPAEVAEAALVETVARAIADELDAHGPFYFPCKCGWSAEFGAGWEDRGRAHRLTCAARAALAAMPAPSADHRQQAAEVWMPSPEPGGFDRQRFDLPLGWPCGVCRGRGDVHIGDCPNGPGLERSVDLTPGDVWSEQQLAVVRNLTAQLHAERRGREQHDALRARVEALAATWTRYSQSAEDRERNRYGAAMEDCGKALRAALDTDGGQER